MGHPCAKAYRGPGAYVGVRGCWLGGAGMGAWAGFVVAGTNEGVERASGGRTRV